MRQGLPARRILGARHALLRLALTPSILVGRQHLLKLAGIFRIEAAQLG